MKKDAFSIFSVVIESFHIYDSRNAVWATNSVKEIKSVDYRMYDEKFDLFRSLGFSTQLYSITYVYLYSFIFLNYGLSVFITQKNIPFLDPFFVFIVMFCIIFFNSVSGFFMVIFLISQVISKHNDFWKTERVISNLRDRIRQEVENNKNSEEEGIERTN